MREKVRRLKSTRLAHLAPKCSSPIHKRGHKRFKCHSLIRHSSEGESKGNFYDTAVKRVEIWLPFDFRSAARLSFRSDFSIPSFSAARVPYLSHTQPCTHTHTWVSCPQRLCFRGTYRRPRRDRPRRSPNAYARPPVVCAALTWTWPPPST